MMSPMSLGPMVKTAVLTFLVLSLSACSFLGLDEYFRDRSDDYRRSEEIEPIKIPEGLDQVAVGELYPVPRGGEVVSYEIDSEFVVPRPRSVAVNESVSEVKIQKLAEDVWILVSVPPSETWPKIRSYLTRNGIPSAEADASRGVIETGLFKLSDNNEVFQQFLISLSQGVQINTTEIEILQRSFPADAVPDSLPEWAEASEDAEREDWLRQGLAEDLASERITGTASLLGQEIGAAAKVELMTPTDDLPFIDMRMPFGRAWASVGYALQRDGFNIVEDDSGAGFYLSDYQKVRAEEKRSFWRRLTSFGRSSQREAVKSYRINVDQVGDSVEVRVMNLDGSDMTQRDNFLVLQMIRNNLA